jgi:hypothetical protein
MKMLKKTSPDGLPDGSLMNAIISSMSTELVQRTTSSLALFARCLISARKRAGALREGESRRARLQGPGGVPRGTPQPIIGWERHARVLEAVVVDLRDAGPAEAAGVAHREETHRIKLRFVIGVMAITVGPTT